MSMNIDTKQYDAFLRGLDREMFNEFRRDFRKDARLFQKEIRADYGGRVLRKRTGQTAKSVKIRLTTFRQLRRGRPVTASIFSRSHVARLHEKGYTHHSGRAIPGKHIFERQTERLEPIHKRNVQQSMHKSIARARR